MEVLVFGACEYACIWSSGLGRCSRHRWGRAGYPEPLQSVSGGGELTHRHTRGKAMWSQRQGLEWCISRPVLAVWYLSSRIVSRPQKPEKARKDFSWSLWGGGVVCPCQHLGFRLLDSRTMKEWVSVVLSLLICGNLLRCSSEKLFLGQLHICTLTLSPWLHLEFTPELCQHWSFCSLLKELALTVWSL